MAVVDVRGGAARRRRASAPTSPSARRAPSAGPPPLASRGGCCGPRCALGRRARVALLAARRRRRRAARAAAASRGRTVVAQVDQAQAPGAEVRLEVRDDGAHARGRGHARRRRAGRVYQVWLQAPGREPEPTAALWSRARDGSAEVAVPGSLDGVEEVLVTDEPVGGSRGPDDGARDLAAPSTPA